MNVASVKSAPCIFLTPQNLASLISEPMNFVRTSLTSTNAVLSSTRPLKSTSVRSAPLKPCRESFLSLIPVNETPTSLVSIKPTRSPIWVPSILAPVRSAPMRLSVLALGVRVAILPSLEICVSAVLSPTPSLAPLKSASTKLASRRDICLKSYPLKSIPGGNLTPLRMTYSSGLASRHLFHFSAPCASI